MNPDINSKKILLSVIYFYATLKFNYSKWHATKLVTLAALFYSPVDSPMHQTCIRVMHVWCIGEINRWIKQRSHSICWLSICLQNDFHFYVRLKRDKCYVIYCHSTINPVMGTIAKSNNMTLVHWPLMGGLLYLVQQKWDWVGLQPAQVPPCCIKCNSPPINGQCTNHHIAV